MSFSKKSNLGLKLKNIGQNKLLRKNKKFPGKAQDLEGNPQSRKTTWLEPRATLVLLWLEATPLTIGIGSPTIVDAVIESYITSRE